jgi:hypothetical protein
MTYQALLIQSATDEMLEVWLEEPVTWYRVPIMPTEPLSRALDTGEASWWDTTPLPSRVFELVRKGQTHLLYVERPDLSQEPPLAALSRESIDADDGDDEAWERAVTAMIADVRARQRSRRR